MTKLIITTDLDKHEIPTQEELLEAGYESLSDYLIDLVYLDTPQMLDKAVWEIVETKSQHELLKSLAENHLAQLNGAVLIDVFVVDPSTFGVSFRHDGAHQVQYVSSLPHILKPYPM